MAAKLILLSAFLALAHSSAIQSGFSYGVHDPHTGDVKNQHETRVGSNVVGQYSLLESDGTRRVVDYSADPHHGFNAVVRKEPLIGHAPIVPAVSYAPVSYAPSPLSYGSYAKSYAAPLSYGSYGKSYAAPLSYGSYGKSYASPLSYAQAVSYTKSYSSPSYGYSPLSYSSAYATPLSYNSYGYGAYASPLSYGGYGSLAYGNLGYSKYY